MTIALLNQRIAFVLFFLQLNEHKSGPETLMNVSTPVQHGGGGKGECASKRNVPKESEEFRVVFFYFRSVPRPRRRRGGGAR